MASLLQDARGRQELVLVQRSVLPNELELPSSTVRQKQGTQTQHWLNQLLHVALYRAHAFEDLQGETVETFDDQLETYVAVWTYM